MIIQEISDGDCLILQIEGRVDANFADEFTERITDACGRSSLVKLDLTGAPYFSSAGLRGLIMGQKIESLKHGKIELYGVNDVLLKILKDTGLDQSMTIYTGGVGTKEPPLNSAPENHREVIDEEKLSVRTRDTEASPGFVTGLPIADRVNQLFVVATQEKTTAWVSLHEKDTQGNWQMLMSSVGFIGREGLGDRGERHTTPRGIYGFEKNFVTCTDDRRAFTDGRVAIPRDKLEFLLRNVSQDCVSVVDELEKLGGSLS